MKNILFAIGCFLCFNVCGQETKEKFDGKKWDAPYILDAPSGWDIERFLIPIEFAPSIPYKGVEDIRFTPGWGKTGSNEYWSYTFLWYLDNTPTFDPETIEKNLTAYYTGLSNINVDKTKIAADKITPVKASIKKRKRTKGDIKTFEGTVRMFDYMTWQPIILNLVIHIRACEGQNKTFVFHEVSPKPYNDPVWKNLDQLWADFKCTK
jgi:hypothetical protein